MAVLQHQMFERSNKAGAGFAPGKDNDDEDCEDDASDDEEEYAEEDDDELEESEEEEEEEDDDDDDSINNDELQLAVDRTILQDQAMLAGTKIAAQDMVNAAAAALKSGEAKVLKTPVKKEEVKETTEPEKISPQAFNDSSAEKVVQNGKVEEVKVEIEPVENGTSAEKVTPAKEEKPAESNKENLSSGKKTEDVASAPVAETTA